MGRGLDLTECLPGLNGSFKDVLQWVKLAFPEYLGMARPWPSLCKAANAASSKSPAHMSGLWFPLMSLDVPFIGQACHSFLSQASWPVSTLHFGHTARALGGMFPWSLSLGKQQTRSGGRSVRSGLLSESSSRPVMESCLPLITAKTGHLSLKTLVIISAHLLINSHTTPVDGTWLRHFICKGTATQD